MNENKRLLHLMWDSVGAGLLWGQVLVEEGLRRRHRACIGVWEWLSPGQVHLVEGVGRRCTPGLRREERAQRAGVGLTWDTKQEQGQAIQVSAQELESLGQALQVSRDEYRHLVVLAREQWPFPKQTSIQQINENLQNMLDGLLPNPSFMVNERWDNGGIVSAGTNVGPTSVSIMVHALIGSAITSG